MGVDMDSEELLADLEKQVSDSLRKCIGMDWAKPGEDTTVYIDSRDTTVYVDRYGNFISDVDMDENTNIIEGVVTDVRSERVQHDDSSTMHMLPAETQPE